MTKTNKLPAPAGVGSSDRLGAYDAFAQHIHKSASDGVFHKNAWEIAMAMLKKIEEMEKQLATVTTAENELRKAVIAFVKKYDDTDEPGHEFVSSLKFVLDETQWWC